MTWLAARQLSCERMKRLNRIQVYGIVMQILSIALFLLLWNLGLPNNIWAGWSLILLFILGLAVYIVADTTSRKAR